MKIQFYKLEKFLKKIGVILLFKFDVSNMKESLRIEIMTLKNYKKKIKVRSN